jgi:hypothetical protein
VNAPPRKIEQASNCRRMKAARTSASTLAGPDRLSFARKEAAPVHATCARPAPNTPRAVTLTGAA